VGLCRKRAEEEELLLLALTNLAATSIACKWLRGGAGLLGVQVSMKNYEDTLPQGKKKRGGKVSNNKGERL